MQCEEVNDLLSGFRDGELSSHERLTVERHIAGCKGCRDALADVAMIARSVKSAGREPVPSGMAIRLQAALARDRADTADGDQASVVTDMRRVDRRPKLSGVILKQAASLAAVVLIAVGATWWLVSNAREADRVELEILNAHIRSLLQDTPVQVASSDQHTVRPWFAGRADFAPAVKDLAAEGYPLLGGRLDYAADRRIGVVVYKRRLHTINVFMWPATVTGDATPRMSTRNGYNLLSWTRGGVAYWAVSDLNAGELQDLQRLL